MKLTLIGLDYLDWSGHGGRHLTAHLTFDDRKRVELERPISIRESKILYPDHSDRFYFLPLARRTNRFESREELEGVATRWCQSNVGGSWILLNHDRDALRRIIAFGGVPYGRVRILNLIEEQWDRLENWERDDQTMDTFYAMWKEWFDSLLTSSVESGKTK